MTDAVTLKPTLGTAVHAITGKWGWFVALGVGELIIGGIASANLMAANLASVLVIGAAMVVAGIFQIVQAFTVRGLRGFLFWQLAGIVYVAAGADHPLRSGPRFIHAVAHSGVFLIVAGVISIWAGFHAAGRRLALDRGCGRPDLLRRRHAGCGLARIGLWLLGVMLVVDLIFQGWGLHRIRARAQEPRVPSFVPAGDGMSHDDRLDIHPALGNCLARRSDEVDSRAGCRRDRRSR